MVVFFKKNRRLRVICFVALIFAAIGNANAQRTLENQRNNATCDIQPGKPLTNTYGPWDYTNLDTKHRLGKVTRAHFTEKVERLIEGETGRLEHDIDFTLRAIPNFHRGLAAMAKLQRSVGFIGEYYTAECYFKRAIYLQPNDPVSRMLYAIHLHLLKKWDAALMHYEDALRLAPNNLEINYNLGLLYLDMENYEKAYDHAQIAYKMGFPLDGLKNRLKESGYDVHDRVTQ